MWSIIFEINSSILQNGDATECICGNLNKQIPQTPETVMFEEKVLPPEDIGTIDTIEASRELVLYACMR